MTDELFTPVPDLVLKADPMSECLTCGHYSRWQNVLYRQEPDGGLVEIDRSTVYFETREQALFCGELAFRHRGNLKVEGEKAEA